jgi:drug/metabolite transporter (DMT)-like permease
MIDRYKNHLLLHFTVLIFGLTGPLGKAIQAPEEVVVFYRLIIALLGIFIYFKLTHFKIDLSKQTLKECWYVGFIVGLHWITFFGAIKASNVSVALVCFSSSTLFTAVLEALYNKRRIVIYELILGLLILVGIYFLNKEPGVPLFESKYALGIGLSVFSAALASWFTVINGTLIKKGREAKTISFVELIFALVLLIFYVPIINGSQTLSVLSIDLYDLIYVAILGLLCTSFAYIVSVNVMKEISAYTVTMSVNLEPIYSIILAILIWPETEKMQPTFYVGAAAILGVIFLNGILKKKFKTKRSL